MTTEVDPFKNHYITVQGRVETICTDLYIYTYIYTHIYVYLHIPYTRVVEIYIQIHTYLDTHIIYAYYMFEYITKFSDIENWSL